MNKHAGVNSHAHGCESIALWLLPSKCLLGNIVSKNVYSADTLSSREIDDLSRTLCPQREESGVALRALLTDLELLEPDGSLQADRRSSDLLCFRGGARYWDYAQPDAFQRDRDDMAKYELAGGENTLLPMGKLVPLEFIPIAARALREAAHHVVDAQYQESFHHEMVHKTRVPSLGSRHGVSFLLSYLDKDLQRRHCVQICPDGLDRISPHPLMESCDLPEVFLLLCAQYERYQWRYRNSWIYQCIFLDLGHIVAAMRVYATHHSLPVIFSEVAGGAIKDDHFLVNEPLVICSPADRSEGGKGAR